MTLLATLDVEGFSRFEIVKSLGKPRELEATATAKVKGTLLFLTLPIRFGEDGQAHPRVLHKRAETMNGRPARGRSNLASEYLFDTIQDRAMEWIDANPDAVSRAITGTLPEDGAPDAAPAPRHS